MVEENSNQYLFQPATVLGLNSPVSLMNVLPTLSLCESGIFQSPTTSPEDGYDIAINVPQIFNVYTMLYQDLQESLHHSNVHS